MSAPRMIDTHTHLCDPVFDDDRDEVLQSARKDGVVSILTVSETLEDAKKNRALSKRYPMLYSLAGLYPTHLDFDQLEIMIAFIRENRDRLVGIGEVGLDFWTIKEAARQAIQREIFIRFIQLSEELSLPLNVHSRSAGRHAIELLLKHDAKKVQLHAFDGKASTALPAVEAGFYFSIPPSIVRSRQKQRLVKHLPLCCMLVETDSPVLGPVPGERNEPKNILKVVDAIADIKEITREEVMETTFHNTLRLYGNNIFQGKTLSIIA
jgi:TatD DNase family protein